eukprot:COSAG01_NODE_78_length_28136_cov_10.014481_10_plen_2561_part_01
MQLCKWFESLCCFLSADCSGPIRGYGKSVCGNTRKPTVNHFFMVDASLSPNLRHVISSDTNNDQHELHGIGPGSPIGYVMYASENGVCHWDRDNEQIFLAAAHSCLFKSFGCSEESSRLVSSLGGNWTLSVRNTSEHAAAVFALRTAPYAVCLNDTILPSSGVISDGVDLVPRGSSLYLHSCPQCNDTLFLSSSLSIVDCQDAGELPHGPGADFAVRVTDAQWAALDGSQNREDYNPLTSKGAISNAINGRDNWVRYRRGTSVNTTKRGFQIDLRLLHASDVDGVSIMVRPVLNALGVRIAAVGYSGIEIWVSTDGGYNYTSAFVQHEMFGAFDRASRTTYTTMASNYLDNQWTSHKFRKSQMAVTNIRIITGEADQKEDSSISFNSIRIDAAGAYDPHCTRPTVCASGFYLAEVETEWQALVTLQFSLNLPAGAQVYNVSVHFEAPVIDEYRASNSSNMTLPIGFEVLVGEETAQNMSLAWILSEQDLRGDSLTNWTKINTPDISRFLQKLLNTKSWTAPQLISVKFGVRRNATLGSGLSSTSNLTASWLNAIPTSRMAPRIQYSANYISEVNYSYQENAMCVNGCTNKSAINFFARANNDDGSCIPTIYGCTEQTALNYNATRGATVNDGSCIANVTGCMNTRADNYDANATTDDGTCNIVICEETAAASCHRNASCAEVNTVPVCTCDDGFVYNTSDIALGATSGVGNFGCTIAILGCTNHTMLNFNSLANDDDGSCIPIVYGCMDSQQSVNYNPAANMNRSCIPKLYGCTDSRAFNFDALANTDDGGCVPIVVGCTQTDAANFHSDANTQCMDAACLQSKITQYGASWTLMGSPCSPIARYAHELDSGVVAMQSIGDNFGFLQQIDCLMVAINMYGPAGASIPQELNLNETTVMAKHVIDGIARLVASSYIMGTEFDASILSRLRTHAFLASHPSTVTYFRALNISRELLAIEAGRSIGKTERTASAILLSEFLTEKAPRSDSAIVDRVLQLVRELGLAVLVGAYCGQRFTDISVGSFEIVSARICASEVENSQLLLPNQCASGPCRNGASCTDLVDGFECACPLGWSGLRCDKNLDECSSLPCYVNGTVNGTGCIDMVDSYACICEAGWSGLNCQEPTRTCDSHMNVCPANSRCVQNSSGLNISTSVSSVLCQCAPGASITLFGNASTCANTNECSSRPCKNSGNCLDFNGYYVCECVRGYSGVHCEHDLRHCPGSHCKDHPISAAVTIGEFSNVSMVADVTTVRFHRSLASTIIKKDIRMASHTVFETDIYAFYYGDVGHYPRLLRYSMPRYAHAVNLSLEPACEQFGDTHSACVLTQATVDLALCECNSSTTSYSVAVVRGPARCTTVHHCAECNSMPNCGWCGGRTDGTCLPGVADSPFYPFSCTNATWEFASCPCSDYTSNCSECLSPEPRASVQGRLERGKRACGFCPSTQLCVEKSMGTSCTPLPSGIHYVDASLDCPASCNGSWVMSNFGVDIGYGHCDPVGGLCQNFTFCKCNPGYHGLNCSQACPGGVSTPCNMHGTCSPMTGLCACDRSHFGTDCSNVCPGGVVTPCSNHGVCQADGSCFCDLGYRGLAEAFDCSTPVAIVEGCMNSSMYNFLPAAVVNVGCIPFHYGCTNTSAVNYDPRANSDDGSCNVDPCAIGSDDCDTNAACRHTGPGAHVCTCLEGYVGNGVVCHIAVSGCMDRAAFNFNPTANVNISSSCVPKLLGCTDHTAFNFNATANTDDNTCVPVQLGCTQRTSWEYSDTANTDDGSCTPIEYANCTSFGNPVCCSNISAVLNSLSPVFATLSERNAALCRVQLQAFMYILRCTRAFSFRGAQNVCNGFCPNLYAACGHIQLPYYWEDSIRPRQDSTQTIGCAPRWTCNSPTKSVCGSLSVTASHATRSLPFVECMATAPNSSAFCDTLSETDTSQLDATQCFSGPAASIIRRERLGCIIEGSFNHNASANTDDGSCIARIYGCMRPEALNYNASANTDDGSCIVRIYGCMRPEALNYNASANTDDGSCIANITGCMRPEALNYNASANTDDGSCIARIYGCMRPEALNYNASANTDDGSCIANITGCTSRTAHNYNSFATWDDGSCITTIPSCADYRNPACCAALQHPLLTANVTGPGCAAHIRTVLYGLHCSETTLAPSLGHNTSSPVLTICPDLCDAVIESCGGFVGMNVSVGQALPQTPSRYVDHYGLCVNLYTGSRNLSVHAKSCFSSRSAEMSHACVPRGTCQGWSAPCNALPYDGNTPSLPTFVDCIVARQLSGGKYMCRDVTENVAATFVPLLVERSACIPTLLGCIDTSSLNYNASANTDDGSCVANITGCTNTQADNFQSNATWDDGSCAITKCRNDENDCDRNATCVHTGPSSHSCSCNAGFVGVGVNTQATFAIGDTNYGIACSDSNRGHGYIMFSSVALTTRFQFPTVAQHQANHFVCVKYDSTIQRWLYDTDSFWFPFVPYSTDTLVAEVNFTADTAVSLLGSSKVVGLPGIHSGFDRGDVVVSPNIWNGEFDSGEFSVSGSKFTVVFGRGCSLQVDGCTDVSALNFHAMANNDDGSCIDIV